MSALDQLARAIDSKAKRAGNGSWSCCCPAHKDRHASLSLSMKDGQLLWRCHAGCSQADVQAELQKRGLLGNGADHTTTPRAKADKPDDWRPIMPVPEGAPEPAFTHPEHGKPSRTWAYQDDGCGFNGRPSRILFYVARFDLPDGSKQVSPRTYGTLNGKTGWFWKAPPEPRPLYQLHYLAAQPNNPVLVVEGEKAAGIEGAGCIRDHVVTTWPGRCKAVDRADWSPLRGRDVVIWPDNDEPGRRRSRSATSCSRSQPVSESSIRPRICPRAGISATQRRTASISER